MAILLPRIQTCLRGETCFSQASSPLGLPHRCSGAPRKVCSVHFHIWKCSAEDDKLDKVNDYEEDNAEYGVESIGWIAAHLKAKDMGWDHLIINHIFILENDKMHRSPL